MCCYDSDLILILNKIDNFHIFFLEFIGLRLTACVCDDHEGPKFNDIYVLYTEMYTILITQNCLTVFMNRFMFFFRLIIIIIVVCYFE